MNKKTKCYPACIRVTFERVPRAFDTGIEMAPDDFAKLGSPRLGENGAAGGKKVALPIKWTAQRNFVNQFGKRKYPREKSTIDFPALGEVAVFYGQYIAKLEAKEQAGTVGYIFPFLEPGMDGYAIRHKVQLVTHLIIYVSKAL